MRRQNPQPGATTSLAKNKNQGENSVRATQYCMFLRTILVPFSNSTTTCKCRMLLYTTPLRRGERSGCTRVFWTFEILHHIHSTITPLHSRMATPPLRSGASQSTQGHLLETRINQCLSGKKSCALPLCSVTRVVGGGTSLVGCRLSDCRCWCVGVLVFVVCTLPCAGKRAFTLHSAVHPSCLCSTKHHHHARNIVRPLSAERQPGHLPSPLLVALCSLLCAVVS